MLSKVNVILLSAGLFVSTGALAECPNWAGTGPVVDNKETCVLNRKEYRSLDMKLTADKNWLLSGGVFIGGDNEASSILRIQPGTVIRGKTGADFLVINRGSKIEADGTQDKPIVFTSASSSNQTRGSWGGLVINGNAPINECAVGANGICQAEGEGSSGFYGGNNPDDNSGTLRYVRVEYAGNEITPKNEMNGIAFQGVGRKTTVDYVQVHMNQDDGVEFFGGTVNVRHLVLTGNRDDSMDWTDGWQGYAQYVFIQQYDDEANRGIEADNNGDKMDSAPRSNPILSNITIIGTSSAAAKAADQGIVLRAGTGVQMHNTVVYNAKTACLDIDDEETYVNLQTGGIQFFNTVLACDVPYSLDSDNKSNDLTGWFPSAAAGESNSIVKFADLLMQGYMPKANSPLLGAGYEPLTDDFWFEPTDYIGAFATTDWTAGWTIR